MAKHKPVRVLALPILPQPEQPLTESEEMAEAWREHVNPLPGPAHWRFNDYMTTYADLGLPVDAATLRRFAKTAMDGYEKSCEQANRPALPLRAPRPPQGRHQPVVYYFRLGDLVKIGTTVDVAQRRTQVPCQGVMAIEWGSYELESQRHAEFIESHQWGEWFRLTEQVGAHIVAVRSDFEASERMSTEQWLAAHR